MHSILWASLLASAGVAVVTTLLVEYLAKPSLEARKERILEDKRTIRLTLNDIKRIIFLCDGITVLQGEEEEPPFHRRLIEFAEELEPLTIEVSRKDVLMNLKGPVAVHDNWINALSTVIATSMLLQDGNVKDEYWRKFDVARNKLLALYVLLTTPRWNYRKRHMLISELAKPIEEPGSQRKEQ